MFSWSKKASFKNKSAFLCLRSTFRPLYIILSFLGLFPYSIKTQDRSHRFSIIHRSIYINTLCAFAYVSTVVAFLILHIRHIYFSLDSMTDGILAQLNYIMELFALTAFCIVNYICVFLNRFKYVDILNTLASRIDPPNVNSKKILGILRSQIKVVITVFLGLIFFVQLCINFTRKNTPWKMILAVFTFNVPQLIQFTTIAFFYILMMMVIAILKNIRAQTLAFVKEKKSFMYGLTNVDSKQQTVTLKQLEEIYMEVFEVKQTVIHIFAAPILVTIMQCSHTIVSESHIIFHGIAIQSILDLHDIINCSVWILYQVIKIYAINSAANKFKQEVWKLGRAIHNIPTERQDLRFMMEVQHFSSMMSFFENDLTIYGFLSLNSTLTFKILASAAMYIIILVQFDKPK